MSIEGALRGRVEKALGHGAGRWWVADYPTQSAESGGLSNAWYDALGLETTPSGTVVVHPMIGDEVIDELEGRVFEEAAAKHGYDIGNDDAYDEAYNRWLDGEGFDEPHEGKLEAYEAHERSLLGEAQKVLASAGFSLRLDEEYSSLEVTA